MRLQARIRDTNLRDIDKVKHHKNELLNDDKESDENNDEIFKPKFRKQSVNCDMELKSHTFT